MATFCVLQDAALLRSLVVTPVYASLPPAKSQAGFSIIELLITLVIGGILTSLASNVWSLVERSRVTSAVNTLATNLHIARSEGILRKHRVTLCQSDDGKTCGTTDRWERGWILFTDPNNNYKLDREEKIIHIVQAFAPGYSVRWRGSTGTNHHLSFLASGGSNKVGTFTVCHGNQPEKAKTVIIIRSGRFRTSTKKSGGKLPDCPG
ncbi:MAG: Tfp pilus assembly protein FimT/FimU [Gammaproteobacteria bacterium]|nr:MAG: Tfp pilus assembly protein FimT/FimU [Gammaproteobacteria bacterium]